MSRYCRGLRAEWIDGQRALVFRLVLLTSLALGGFLAAFGLSQGFQLVELRGHGWVLPLGVEAKSRHSAKTGKTWLYLRIDKEELGKFVWPISLIAHVWISGRETVFPVDLPTGTIRCETNKELSPGTIQRLFFSLEKLSIIEGVPLKVYDGPIAHDKPCFADLMRAMKMGGVAGRKLTSDLLTTGCVKTTPGPMKFSIIRTEVLQGVKADLAGMVPGGPADSDDLLFGYILPNLITEVQMPTPIEVQKAEFPIYSADVNVTEGVIETDY